MRKKERDEEREFGYLSSSSSSSSYLSRRGGTPEKTTTRPVSAVSSDLREERE